MAVYGTTRVEEYVLGVRALWHVCVCAHDGADEVFRKRLAMLVCRRE